MSHPPQTAPLQTWLDMTVLLIEAGDRGSEAAATDPAVHSLALGADIVAARAIDLIPPALDAQLDDVAVDADCATASTGDLIRAAVAVAARHPVTDYPDGAATVLSSLHALAAEAGA